MSYILEALKRSQQARELGRAPTLDTSGMFEEDKIEPARVPWPLVATGLAVVAVLIAVYGVMRGPGVAPAGDDPVGMETGAASPAAPWPAAVPSRPASMEQMRASAVPMQPDAADRTSMSLERPSMSASQWIDPAAMGLPPETIPLVEPPPPKGGIDGPEPETVARPAPVPLPPSRGLSRIPEVPIIHPHLSGQPEIDSAMELELQRQLDEELDEMEGGSTGYGRPPTAIPSDLVADIEAFKDTVRQERGMPANAQRTPKALPNGDLTKLRLTETQRAGLPFFVVTVHVYDAEAERRFVVVNGLKYREGSNVEDGLRVERILPEGVVLSYQDHPFFVRP